MMDNNDYFDFEAEGELPEGHSQDSKMCPHCGKPIPADSLFCLYCGQRVWPSRKNIWVVLIAILVLAAFITWAIL